MTPFRYPAVTALASMLPSSRQRPGANLRHLLPRSTTAAAAAARAHLRTSVRRGN